MTLEASSQSSIRRRLDRAGAKGVKANPSNGAGTPDLLYSYRGRFLALEVKAPGPDRTARGRRRRQLHEQGEWAKAGAVVATVRSVADVERVLAFVDATSPAPNLPIR